MTQEGQGAGQGIVLALLSCLVVLGGIVSASVESGTFISDITATPFPSFTATLSLTTSATPQVTATSSPSTTPSDTPASPTATLSPTITPTPTTTCGPPAGWVLYTVQAGDTLYSLSRAFGVTVAQLQQANCMGSSTTLVVGRTIYVPNVPTITPTKTPKPPKPTDTEEPSHTATGTNTATATPTETETTSAQ